MPIHVMQKPQQARQGDVLLFPIPRRPREDHIGKVLKEGKRLVLAHGEVTGHAHAIYPEQDIAEGVHNNPEPATLYELHRLDDYVPTTIKEGMYLEVRERCYLRHEEHDTIVVAPGHYAVIRQVEWTEDMRRFYVAD